jgi:aminoglycoside phosphotransferase (APT) family kinase protein
MTANMPAAELTVDADLVRALLRDQHPDLAALELREVASGWDNVVFRLGDELAVRVPRRRLGAELIQSELRWLPELAPRLPLPVPVPVRVGRPGTGYPWSWSVVAWMDGADAATDPPRDPLDAARVLGAFLSALHQPAPPGAPANGFRGGPLADRDEIMRRDLGRLPADVDADRALAEWEAALALDPYDGPPVWLHGDLHPANLVVHEGRLAGVVDFGDLTAGDPATDLLVAWSLLPFDAHPIFRAAAGGADDATWRRARGWALTHAVACLASSADHVKIAGFSRRGLAAVLADADR